LGDDLAQKLDKEDKKSLVKAADDAATWLKYEPFRQS
jgi:hypothetical protein